MVKQNNNMKVMIFLAIGLFLITTVTASLGTFQENTEVDLIQTCNNCTYCNLTSIKYPNGTNAFTNVEMTKDNTYFNYTFNETYTSTVGEYKYCYDCGNNVERATGCINFDITLSGNPTPEGVSYLLIGIVIIIFGIACVFLYLTTQMESPGFKVFFMLLAFVFLIGSLSIMSIMATDSNLTSGVNTSISIMLYSFGLVFFVFFAYIMINQTRNILAMMQEKKGYEVY